MVQMVRFPVADVFRAKNSHGEKRTSTKYQGFASCSVLAGSVWVETVWWWNHVGSSLVFWHQTQQHMQATQLRDTLSLGFLSPPHTPETPVPPFPASPCFPRTMTSHTLSRVGGITWECVCMSVCLSSVSMCLNVSETESTRKKTCFWEVPV